MWAKDEDGKIPYFSARAEELARQVQASESSKTSSLNDGTSSEPAPRRFRNRNNGGRGRNKDRVNSPQRPNAGRKRRHEGNRAWNRKCLNREKCDGVHRIEDCPVTSENDKKRLLNEHIAKLKRLHSKTEDQEEKRQRRSGRSLASEGSDYDIDVAISGVDTKARDDTGADMTVIPMRLLTQILSQNPNMNVDRIDKPIEVQLAVKGRDIPKVII